MFPSTLSQETSGLSGNKTNCFPQDVTLSVYCFEQVELTNKLGCNLGGTSPMSAMFSFLMFSLIRVNKHRLYLIIGTTLMSAI